MKKISPPHTPKPAKRNAQPSSLAVFLSFLRPHDIAMGAHAAIDRHAHARAHARARARASTAARWFFFFFLSRVSSIFFFPLVFLSKSHANSDVTRNSNAGSFIPAENSWCCCRPYTRVDPSELARMFGLPEVGVVVVQVL